MIPNPMPVGGGPNLHVALAMHLGRPTQWTDAALLADVAARCLPLLDDAREVAEEKAEPQQFQDVPLPGMEMAT